MKTIRIFISSPGDVAVERDKARKVVENLQKRYAGRLRLETVLWEDLPLGAVNSFQDGIDVVLKGANAIDIAVFILWSRLGSPLGATIRKPDGSLYRSGTEREFDLMLSARVQSPDQHPEILVYVRQDDRRFKAALQDKPTDEIEDMLRQHRLAEQFIREQFQDAETGVNLRAYHTFPDPNSFAERLKAHLRNLLDAIALDGGLPVGTWEGSPYRGLEVFRSEHAPIFFGRDEEVCEALERLRSQAEAGCAFLLLVGASGSGKSSLARAGILPALESDNPDESVAEWRTATLTPGACTGGLCRELARILLDRISGLRGDEQSLDDLEQALRDGQGKALSLLLRRACAGTEGRGPVRLVLLIDQLEELFTHSGITESETVAFLAALQALAVSGSVWVLATVRSDFYGRCQQYPVLMAMKGDRGQMDLLPPKPSDIHRIITGPAVLAGVTFEKNAVGESLDQRLLNDAVSHLEALPLLEFALAQLYEARTAEGLLTFSAYDALGGVEGAIGCHAEAVFAAQPEPVRAAFDPVFGALVSLDEDDEARPVRRRVALDALAATPERRQLVEALLDARLLSSDRGEVFVVHEALLRRWERAVQWIAANRNRLRVRDRLAARRAEGSPLAENDPLTNLARYHLTNAPDVFDPELRRFIEAQLAALEKKRKRRNRIRQAVVAGLAALAAFALFQWQKAEKARAYANTARGQAEELINFMTFDLRDKLAPVGRLDLMAGVNQAVESYHQKRAAAEAKAGRKMGSEELRRRSASLVNQGDNLCDKGDLSGALKAYRESLGMAERLAALAPSNAVCQYDLSVSQNKIGDVLMAQGDQSGALKAYRKSLAIRERLAASDSSNLGWQYDLSSTLDDICGVLMAQGDLSGALKACRESLGMAERLAALAPSNAVCQCDLSASQSRIGDVLMEQGDLSGALKAYRELLAVSERLAALAPSNAVCQRNLSVSLNKIGDVLMAQGDLSGALKAHRKSLSVAERLAASDPLNAKRQRDLIVSHVKIGDVLLRAQGDLAGALKAYRECLGVAEHLAALDPSNAGWQHDMGLSRLKIGDVLYAQVDLSGALKAYRESLGVAERLVTSDPSNAGWQRDLSMSQNKIGDVLKAQGDLAGALKAYRESLAIRERLAASDPSNAGWQRDLFICHVNIGDVLSAQGELSGALKAYRESLGVAEHLAVSDPSNTNWQSDRALCQERVGTVLNAQGDFAGAQKAYRESLAIRERLAASAPSNAGWQRDLSVSLNKIGNVLSAQGDLAGALKAYRESLSVAECLVASDPLNMEWQHDVSANHERIGTALRTQGDLSGALKAYREFLAVSERLAASAPSNADWQHDLFLGIIDIGDVLSAQGDLAGALKAYRESLGVVERLTALDPLNMERQHDVSANHERIGDVLMAQGDLSGALKAYREFLSVAERLAASAPSNAGRQRDLCGCFKKMGLLAKKQEQYADAKDWFAKELDLAERLSAVSPTAEAASLRIEVLSLLVECELALKDFTNAWSHQTHLVLLLHATSDKEELAGELFVQGTIAEELSRYGDAFSAITESLAIAATLADVDQQWLIDANGSLCWVAMLAGKYSEALRAGEKSVSLLKDEKPCPLRMNLAHACLFNGQFEKAQAIYAKYCGTSFEDGRKWDDEVRNDFKTLRAAGRDHPDMKKIEALLDVKNAAP